MKTVVVGANGQLGTDLCRELTVLGEVVALTHADVDITDRQGLRRCVESLRVDAVVNTASFHNVPQCETEPQRAFAVNGLGALNLATVAQELGVALLHFSTDYVFDGAKRSPYVETDLPNPLNMYAVTKLAGEHIVLNYCDRSFVVRVSGIYGEIPCRAKGHTNFVTTMIRLSNEKPVVRVVDNEILSPTWTRDIAQNTASLLETEAYGLYHMSAQGACSWYEFARAIFDILSVKTPLEPVSAGEFPSPVARPSYSVLENKALGALGIDNMTPWRDGLEGMLDAATRNPQWQARVAA